MSMEFCTDRLNRVSGPNVKMSRACMPKDQTLRRIRPLAAQCEIPPYRAIPFRDSIAEGGMAPICLVFIGYRASIAEIPSFGGGIAPPLRMLSTGEALRKGGGGIAPNWPR